MTLPAVRKLLIVGDRGGTNVGACLERAALGMGLEVRLAEVRRAMEAPKWVRRFNWHLRGHRPTHLEAFSAEVVALCRDWRPDILLATGGVPLTATALADVRAGGAATFNYSTDDPWNPAHASKWFLRALPQYSAVFSARRANLEDFRAAGCASVSYLPFGYDPALHYVEAAASPEQMGSDVLFIGGADRDREPYCRILVDAGLQLALFGDYWTRYPGLRASFRGYADVQTLRTATNAARVCLILARRANRDGHTMRSFEAAAMGGCLLVEDTREHRDLFGDTVTYFGSIQEMVQGAKHLLASPAERQRLAAASHRRVRGYHHTYADRLLAMLAILPAREKPPPSCREPDGEGQREFATGPAHRTMTALPRDGTHPPGSPMDELRVSVSVFGRFHAFDLARQLQQAGVLAQLITTYPRYFAKRWGLPRAKIVSLPVLEALVRLWAAGTESTGRGHLARAWFCRRFDRAATAALRRDANVFVGWSSYCLGTLRAARAAGLKTVVDRGSSHIGFQTDLLMEEYARHGYAFHETPAEVSTRELQEYAEADRIAVPSRYVRRTFVERGIAPEKLLHLPYGVSLEKFSPVAKRDTIFRVMHCGALSLRKGVHYLLQAFHELDLPRAELWLVGAVAREMRPFLARYRSDKIVLKGTHLQRKLRWFYSQCSVFCLASVDDGFGLVIAQAMACGLPVIHTTNTGGADIIDDRIQGFEVPIRDVNALKEKFLYLYENPGARDEMGRQARARAVKALSWDHYGQRVVAAYGDLLRS